MMDILWVLISALLVFLIQAGFLCLETGRTRSKNNINVAAKNMIDFMLSSTIFWLFGFGLMFGSSSLGLFGTDLFLFGEDRSAFDIAFFIFQMMFCATAATIISGAIAERMTFLGYVMITVIVTALIYPMIGHWAWGGLLSGEAVGWLSAIGFIDFAGSTVVHSVGGWCALAAVFVIGSRYGRFEENTHFSSGSNLPMATLGGLLIVFGWFGFNGGSTLVFDDSVPKIIMNTCLAAVWGGLATAILCIWDKQYVDVSEVINGIIGGLVSITAGCFAVSVFDASVIGFIGGLIVYCGGQLLIKLKIDDALGVVPTHLMTGIWGTLAVALFGDPQILGTGLHYWEQLGVQLLGIVVVGLYSFIFCYALLRMLDHFVSLRVSLEDEIKGLNISEHHANTELIDLLTDMEVQQQRGDFTTPVVEEPFTEVGQIANKYNQIIKVINKEMIDKDDALKQLQSSENQKSAILDAAMDSIICINKKGSIIEFNPAAQKLFGCSKKLVMGKKLLTLFVDQAHVESFRKSLQEGFSSPEGVVLNSRTDIDLRRISGEVFPAEVTITRMQITDQSGIDYTLHIRDVAKDRKLQSDLNFLAYKDPLTGLSNRTSLMKRLPSSIAKGRESLESVALYFLDLDKFKKINDTLGHQSGDELLCEVAKRLTSVSRSSDVVVRWGGDEFIFVIEGKLNEKVIVQKAHEILNKMREPILIQGKPYNIPTSIGIAVSDQGDIDADELIQRADIAMYSAKMSGRDTYKLYTQEMRQEAVKVLNYELEIKDALKNNEFFLEYQPKYEGDSKKIIASEALIRWQHPKNGRIPPNEFISVAEESALIIDIGEFVINKVLMQLNNWKRRGMVLMPVSINISGKQLTSDNFVHLMRQKIKEYKIEPELIEIEITEGVLIQDMQLCINVLTELKGIGIKISIDDFGTGYSSLNYLRKLPVDILKIDRSFVAESVTVDEDREICMSIINLANGLGLKTIAEGVESQEQVDVLSSLGCHLFQGFYFSKPISPESFFECVQNQKKIQVAG